MERKRTAYYILLESQKEGKPRGGCIILKRILEIGWGGMDGNYLAHDRDQWRALVNMVMNSRVP
jgi:hypothetical protein